MNSLLTKSLPFLALCLVPIFSNAQVDIEIDSLRSELLSPEIEDSTRVLYLNRLGELFVFQDPDSAKKYLTLAHDLATKIDDQSNQARSYLLRGSAYESQSMYDSAIYFANEAYQIYEDLSDTIFMGNALSNIGLAYEAKGLKEKGADYHLQSLELFIAKNDPLGMGKTYNNLGILFKTMGKLDEAASYYKKSAEAFSVLQYPFGEAALLNNAAGVQLLLEQYDTAYTNAKKALDIFIELDIEQFQPSALEIIGASLFKQGQTTSAIDTLILAQNLFEKYDNKKELSIVKRRLAECFLEEGDFGKALENGNSALSLAEEVEALDEMMEANRVLSTVYSSQGNYKKALETFEAFKSISDSIVNEKNLNRISELEIKFEISEKEREIAQQDLEIVNKESQIQQQNLQLGFLGAGIVIVILGGGLFYNYSRNKQKNLLQEAVIAEQERGLEAVFTATEEERKRIAKDLHDGVGQQLSALKRGFEELTDQLDSGQKEKAAGLKKLVDDTADDTREISHQMMPKALTEFGLVPAIEDSLNKTLGSLSVEFEFEHFNLQDRYDEQKEVAVYRIFQELVNNVIKHSGADKLNLQLFENQSKLILIIEDNGKGIQQQSADGVGILNIKNRLKTFDGRFNLDPNGDSGTTATASIPV
ncbi:MAG: tetratricopeptide repeat protein [Bacteroidota bacterium]